MSNTFVSGVVDGGNDPWWGQTKDYEIVQKERLPVSNCFDELIS